MEQRYAQIEKEALGIMWACERLQNYLIGRSFYVHTDHKHLIPLLSSKSLDELPVRIQRFRMHLMRFDFTISHVPGKSLILADVLSCFPLQQSRETLIFLGNLICMLTRLFVNFPQMRKDWYRFEIAREVILCVDR